MSTSNIYLAADVQRPEQSEAIRQKFEAQGKVWPKPRSAKMEQLPSVYQVRHGSLVDETKVRDDVKLAKELFCPILVHDWEVKVDASRPNVKCPAQSFSHTGSFDESNAILEQIVQAAEWIHDEGGVPFGVYDLPTSWGDKSISAMDEISMRYNARMCMNRQKEFAIVGQGALAVVDYCNPLCYRPANITVDRYEQWLDTVKEVCLEYRPDARIISWFWSCAHPRPHNEYPMNELERMLDAALGIGDVMVYTQEYDELTGPVFDLYYDRWNRCVG